MLGLENWTLARPEIFLAAASALLLLYGVLRGEASATFVSYASALALLVTAVLLFMPFRDGTAFANLFVADRLTATMKALVLIGSAIAILMSRGYFERVLTPAKLVQRVSFPVQGGVGVAATHALDEGRHHVVVLVAGLVVHHGPPARALHDARGHRVVAGQRGIRVYADGSTVRVD